MTGTKITMSGADTAHYRDAMALSSRLLTFPDGIQRHITLTKWEWQVYDRWPLEHSWHATRLLERALQIVREVQAEIGSHHAPYGRSALRGASVEQFWTRPMKRLLTR